MDKQILITGGAQRIGKQLVNHFHDIGWDILFQYRSSSDSAINICNQFIRILDMQQEQKTSYKNKYEETLSNLLIKKLGKSTYESIQQKAHMLTISELMEQN